MTHGPTDDDPAATPERLMALLRRWDPVDEREQASIEQFIHAFERLEAPFDRVADATHVTGSALVAGARGVVLHQHKRTGTWMQPGGHLDPGETPAKAALRETREETGLAVRHAGSGPLLVHVDAHHVDATGHTHLDVRYLLEASEERDPAPEPGESPQAAWFPWDRALEIADDALVGALRRLERDGWGRGS